MIIRHIIILLFLLCIQNASAADCDELIVYVHGNKAGDIYAISLKKEVLKFKVESNVTNLDLTERKALNIAIDWVKNNRKPNGELAVNNIEYGNTTYSVNRNKRIIWHYIIVLNEKVETNQFVGQKPHALVIFMDGSVIADQLFEFKQLEEKLDCQ